MLRMATFVLGAFIATGAQAQTFSIEQISAPFAVDVTASPEGGRFAWVSNQAGRRNVWPCDSAGNAISLTHYNVDDDIDLSDLNVVPHHEQFLFVRGGGSFKIARLWPRGDCQ